MSTMTMAPQTGGHRCNCGCSDCMGECCELEYLVQPRFFCGQLLTDQDLNALLEWVKGKTALARYRDGWGVACGLDVHCSAGPGKEGFVSVTPGYAIDCCGNDIIVREEAEIDLSKYCLVDEGPCRDRAPMSAQRSAAQSGTTPGTPGPNLSFGGWEIQQSEVQAVDLFIGYAETASDARNALAKRACDAVEVCEYTRTHEGYHLYAKKAEHCDHSAERRALDWEEEYGRKLKELFNDLQAISTIGNAKQRVERLSQWLTSHALHSFSFIREWLCELQRLNEPTAGWFEKMIFWLVQDWRSHYLGCECYGCGPDTGVHLARVWLWRRKDERGRAYCKVIYINPYPPFRRPLQRECWPGRPGYLNVARFIWQPTDYVVGELSSLGFGSISTAPFTYGNLEGLRTKFADDHLFVPRGDGTRAQRLIIYSYQDICQQSRVVRFGVETAPIRTDVNVNAALTKEDVKPVNQTTTGTAASSGSTPTTANAEDAKPATGPGLEPPASPTTPLADPTAGPPVNSNGPALIANNSPAAEIVIAPDVPITPAVANPVGRTAIDPDTLPPTHPLLEIQQVKGIGPVYAMRLEEAGIMNLRDLSKSNPATVKQALAGGPPNRPAEDIVQEAAERIRKLKEGT
ncbi:MAG TPA: helix-hairpin-helix domain-containing protein [Blastocatellia bacterium]|nr:helix-hairpin-helix domain-containing protein [Blastocatellia bacterium]